MMKKILAVLLAALLVAGSLSGCGTGNRQLVGKWYDKDGRCLDLRKNGTWQMDGLYGSGTWERLDDDYIELTDFYGEIDEGELCEDANGSYIHYYGRDFYKGEYPDAEQDDQSPEEILPQDQIGDTTPVETEPQAVDVDPFEGLSIEVTGVSPFCKLMVNNAGCSEDAQLYVEYTTDAAYYQNGDTAVVTASLNRSASAGDYVLTETQMTFEVENQPQYITSAEGVDLSLLESEVQDLITAKAAAALNSPYLFDADYRVGTHLAIKETTQNAVYLTSRKMQKHEVDTAVHNSIIYIYTVTTWTHNESYFSLHVAVHAQNVILYPDGSITWGGSNLELVTEKDHNGLEAIIASQITSQTADYNITKLE